MSNHSKGRSVASMAALTAVVAGTMAVGAGLAFAQDGRESHDAGCQFNVSYGKKHDTPSWGQGYYDSMKVEVSPDEAYNECTPIRKQKISVAVTGPDPECKMPDAAGRVWFETGELSPYLLPVTLYETKSETPPEPYVCDR